MTASDSILIHTHGIEKRIARIKIVTSNAFKEKRNGSSSFLLLLTLNIMIIAERRDIPTASSHLYKLMVLFHRHYSN